MPEGIATLLMVVFSMGATWLLWVFLFYPVVVAVLARVRPRPLALRDGYEPTVAFVMAAYNEEHVISARLDNYALLDYPPEKLRFLIGSDASTDQTDAIVRSYAMRDRSISLQRFERCGKTRIVYELASQVDTEIIVFTDADILLEREGVRRIVRCFSDPAVGGVIGRMVYTDPDAGTGNAGQKKYLELENGLRRSESLVWTTVGPRGECFAVRRGAYTPLKDFRLSDDLNLVITIPLNGYRVWYEPSVVIHETSRRSLGTEYSRRLRMGQQAAATLLAYPRTRLPWKSWLALELWSHKLLRILAAIPLAVIATTSIPLASVHPVFAAVAIGVGGWTLTIGLGWLGERVALHVRAFQYPLYFTAMIVSLTIGSVRGVMYGGLDKWSRNRAE